jgi:hypothetical protein
MSVALSPFQVGRQDYIITKYRFCHHPPPAGDYMPFEVLRQVPSSNHHLGRQDDED